MNCYRIYTERRQMGWLRYACSELFPGFTIYNTTGFWKGKREKSVVIEVLTETDRDVYLRIKTLAKMLKGYGKQEAVLVTKHRVDAEIL